MFDAADRDNIGGIGGRLLREVVPRRPKIWFRYPRLLQLNLLLMGALICDVTNGFDQSMVNGLLILESWTTYFGNPQGAHLAIISVGTRIGQIGALFVISPLIRKLGRRWPILIGSSIILLGVALQAAAQNSAMFVIGRVILGFGNNIQQCSSIVLISELAYPSHRPRITAIMNSTGSIGTIVGAWITYGSAGLQPSSWSWRLPLLLQVVPSIFQGVMAVLVPESPRWLLANDCKPEARAILTKYHGDDDEHSELVRFEMAEFEHTIRLDNNKQSRWMEWLRTPANRHRFFIVLTLSFLIQWCGNAIISYYIRLILETIGINVSSTQLLINGALPVWGLGIAICSSLLIERVGRRKLFLTGMAGMFCAWLTLTVLSAFNQGNTGANGLSIGAIVMIFIHVGFYKIAGPTQDPYFMEISPYNLRAQTSVIKSFGDACTNLFSGVVNPIGIEHIGWRYYIVWCCVLVSNFAIIYYWFPETKGLSLEEVTQMFEGGLIPEEALTQHRDGEQNYGTSNVTLASASTEDTV